MGAELDGIFAEHDSPRMVVRKTVMWYIAKKFDWSYEYVLENYRATDKSSERALEVSNAYTVYFSRVLCKKKY